jgi:hypothetical protein
MIQPIQIDFSTAMVEELELDQAATELNLSLQAVIKALIRQALDYHHMAQQVRKAG